MSNLKATTATPLLKSEAEYHTWIIDFEAYLATQNMLKVTRDNFKPPQAVAADAVQEERDDYDYKLNAYNHEEERYYGALLIALGELPTLRAKILKAYIASNEPLPRGTSLSKLLRHEIMENPLSARYSSIAISADQFNQGLLNLPDALNHLDRLWQRLPDALKPTDRAKIMRLRGALHREWVDSIKTMTLANMAMSYEEVCAGLLMRYYENLADKAHGSAENDSAHAADDYETDDDGDDSMNYAHEKRGRDRSDRDRGRSPNRGDQRGAQGRGYDRDRDYRGLQRSNRGRSQEREYRGISQERERYERYDRRDNSQERRGNSQDRGQYERYNRRGSSQERGGQQYRRSPSPYVNHRKADFRGGKRRSFSRSPHRDQRRRANTPPPSRRRVSFIKCYRCGEVGHKANSDACNG
jgi:hypothetical protein